MRRCEREGCNCKPSCTCTPSCTCGSGTSSSSSSSSSEELEGEVPELVPGNPSRLSTCPGSPLNYTYPCPCTRSTDPNALPSSLRITPPSPVGNTPPIRPLPLLPLRSPLKSTTDHSSTSGRTPDCTCSPCTCTPTCQCSPGGQSNPSSPSSTRAAPTIQHNQPESQLRHRPGRHHRRWSDRDVLAFRRSIASDSAKNCRLGPEDSSLRQAYAEGERQSARGGGEESSTVEGWRG